MKPKPSCPTSSAHKGQNNQLWKNISLKDDSPLLESKKRTSTITDFLKTVHHHENSQIEASESDVVSVIYIKNPNFGSLQSYIEEKKFFFRALFSAIRSIWSEINCLSDVIRSEMKRDFDKLRMMIDQALCGYKQEINMLNTHI